MTSLSDRLLERGMVTPADLARAREVQERTNGRFAATLVRLGLVAEEDLAETTATRCDRPLLGKDDLTIEDGCLAAFNHRFLARHAVLPLGGGEAELAVAMADPDDLDAIAALEFASGRSVSPFVATFSDIADVLDNHAQIGDDNDASVLGIGGAAGDVERLLEEESEAPVIRAVQRLLTNAVNRRASDVHIEPMARYVAVRYRIDGRLVEVEKLPDAFAVPIASRIKVMAALDIGESRLPQDGRLRLTVRGRDVDVRVSTSPTNWGESIVLRLLGRSEVPLDLDRLGLPPAALATLHRALDRPHGIILLTGPTGSGKTTTLYAAINRLRRPEVKILTVEDPVEVLLEGVNQVQVRPEIELSYAATLRAFLRQDPDILMIGEIRDRETAEIALRAALTGHLVLSTLHTNSALGAFTRLADIGIEPYLTASTVVATIAQRLIRALCPHCREARPLAGPERAMFDAAALDPPLEVSEPLGCPHCLQSGYIGRVPLIEIVEIDERLRERIRFGTIEQDGPTSRPGETLLSHGLALIAAGKTSVAEVRRAVQLP